MASNTSVSKVDLFDLEIPAEEVKEILETIRESPLDLKDLTYPENLNTEPFNTQYVIKASSGARIYTGSNLTLYTKFIPVEGHSRLVYTRVRIARDNNIYTAKLYGCAFYREDNQDQGSFISGELACELPDGSAASYEFKEIEVPQEAKYMRCTWLSYLGESYFGVYDYERYMKSMPGRLKKIDDGIGKHDTDITNLNNSITSLNNSMIGHGHQIFEIDQDIIDIKDDIDDIKDELFSENLNTEPWNLGSVIRVSDGGLLENMSSGLYTDYIDISGLSKLVYTKIYTSNAQSPKWGCAFYNTNKTFISGGEAGVYDTVNHYELSEIAVPSSAKYVRFTWFNVSYLGDNFAVYDYDAYMNTLQGRFKKIEDKLFVENLNTSNLESGIIRADTGTEAETTGTSLRTGFINVEGYSKLIYTRICSTASSVAAGCAFYDTNKEFISGEPAESNSPQYTYKLQEIQVPNDAKYARFTWNSALGVDKFAVYNYDNYTNSVQAMVSEHNTEIADIQTGLINIRSDVDDIEDKLFYKNLNTESLIDHTTINSTTGAAEYGSATTSSCTVFIYIENYSKLIYTRPIVSSSMIYGCAFYNENKNPSGSVSSYISGQSYKIRESEPNDQKYMLQEIEVPQGAKYARFTWNEGLFGEGKFAVYDYDRYMASMQGKVEKIEKDIDEIELKELQKQSIVLGLHTEPSSVGQLNVIKRARQMTDIKWTPAVDLPRFMYVTSTPPSSGEYDKNKVEHYLGVFKAGKEYKGIPYGRCFSLGGTYTPTGYDYGYKHTYVGIDIDFETFVTAVQSKQSIIAKKDFGSSKNHISTPYAAVCSVLVNYALGLDTFYEVADMTRISGLNQVGSSQIKTIDLSEIKLGDVLYNRTEHVAIITDITRNSLGNVTCVEVSEATTVGEALYDEDGGGSVGGVCRRLGFTTEDFIARFGEYYLRRYAYISNVTYTPSKYVSVGGESDMFRLGRLPCMPYMGEGFAYKSGKIPNKTIVLENNTITENGVQRNRYGYLRVFNDGIEISGSPFTVSSGVTSVDVGFNDVGTYVAYLCNMEDKINTSVTAKCHWSVVEDDAATGNDIDGDEVIGE